MRTATYVHVVVVVMVVVSVAVCCCGGSTYLSMFPSPSREGSGFYSRIHDNVSKLRKRVFEVLGTRSRERENVER